MAKSTSKSASTQAHESFIIARLIVGQLATNCYLVGDPRSREALIVDPGDDADYIQNKLRDLSLIPTQVVATHGHFDHILAAWELTNAYNIPFFIHKKDEFLVKRMHETARHFLQIEVVEPPPSISSYLSSNSKIQLGNAKFELLETPGHTPGSVCLHQVTQRILLTGDTIFAEGEVGRTDFQYSSISDLRTSIGKLFNLPYETVLYPGHGEATTLGVERMNHGVQ